MERLSFLNYVYKKEKQYLKQSKKLEKILVMKGGNGKVTVDLKTIQTQLVKIKKKIEDINKSKKEVVIDPYNKLKDIIDSINYKVEGLQSTDEIDDNSDAALQKSNLINKLNQIDILLDGTDYTTVNTNKKLSFLKEKIDTNQVSLIFDKYINDTRKLLDNFKIQIGKGESLVDNTQILENTKEIRFKILDYCKSIGPILEIENEVLKFIEEMESLFNLTIEPLVPIKPDDPGEKIEVVPIEQDEKFSFFEPDRPDDPNPKIESAVDSDSDLIKPDFLINAEKTRKDAKKPVSKETRMTKEIFQLTPKNDTTPKPSFMKTVRPVLESPEYENSPESPPARASPTQNIKNIVKSDPIKRERSVSPITQSSLQPRKTSLQPQPRETLLQPRKTSLQTQTRETSLQPRETSLQPRIKEISSQLQQNTKEGKENLPAIKNKYLAYNEKYLIEPKEFHMATSYKQLNKTMNDLYVNWMEKILNLKKVIKEILPFKKLSSDLKDDLKILASKREKILTIKYKYPEKEKELEQLLQVMAMEEQVNKETIKQCNLFITKLQDEKVMDELIKQKCKYVGEKDKIEQEYNKVDLFLDEKIKEIQNRNSEIETKKTELIKIIKSHPSDSTRALKIMKENIDYLLCLFSITIKNLNENDFEVCLANYENKESMKQSFVKSKSTQSDKGIILNFSIDEKKKGIELLKFITKKSNQIPETTDELIKEIKSLKVKDEKKEETKNKYYSISLLGGAVDDEKTLPPVLTDTPKASDEEKTLPKASNEISKDLPECTRVQNMILPDSGTASINDFIGILTEFERVLREMIQKRKIVIRAIKKYNVRYTQFYNFQKYIVNYVSLTLAQKSYQYYNFLSKGTISFYQSVLNNMNKMVDKFENPKEFGKESKLNEKDYQLLYSRHYFIIKILNKFFDELYAYWDKEAKTDPTTWDIANKIDIEARPLDIKGFENGNGNGNKKYFFLFNIFFKILDAYYMRLPPVANYLRINNIEGIDFGNITFEKDTKNFIKKDGLESCLIDDPEKGIKTESIKITKFEEVFDDKFKDNSSLSMYMGLGNSLGEGRSIMLLTYGYSGVGKTFTLFGRKGKPGMLQTTLNNLTNFEKIELKAFELYGLGVPYKFYWNKPKSENKIPQYDHRIYKYEIDNMIVKIDPSKAYYEYNEFQDVLDKNQKYNLITKEQIEDFSSITEQIDKIRKNTGRIKATINNPDSSRSIMIYDFKITFKPSFDNPDKPREVKFVVMDLPGKENLYQTYCSSVDKEEPTVAANDDKFRPKEEFYFYKKGPGDERKMDQPDPKLGHYDIKMIKAMMYINPLWLASIPEIAEYFDVTNNHLGTENLEIDKELKSLKAYGTPSELRYVEADGHLQTGSYFGASGRNKFNEIQGNVEIAKSNLGLYGMFERSFSKILNLIRSPEDNKSKLFELAEKINNMLKDDDAKQKKYGYAGLEGIYINENILGLLEVLAQKIQKDNNRKNPVSVVCPQKEIYKKLAETDSKISQLPISAEIIKTTKTTDTKASQDEFYSQALFFRSMFNKIRTDQDRNFQIQDDSFFQATKDDSYKTLMRKITSFGIPKTSIRKGLSDNIEDNKNNWINNYDYNRIFNIEDPPIKSILKDYLEDETFKNFYLFFVVSNNMKEKKNSKGEIVEKIDTCEKQIQLIYDTKDFMDVIANENASGVVCSNDE
jgi:hypothetical protein